MHDGKIIILFPFFLFIYFLFRNLDYGDADLICCNKVNCLDRFFWIKNGLCDVPVKGQNSNQVWTCLGPFGPKGFRLPSEGKFLSKERVLIKFGDRKSVV